LFLTLLKYCDSVDSENNETMNKHLLRYYWLNGKYVVLMLLCIAGISTGLAGFIFLIAMLPQLDRLEQVANAYYDKHLEKEVF